MEVKRQQLYPWLVVALLWLVWLLNYVDRQLIFSVFPLLESDLHLNPLQLGFTSTVFLFVYALASPFAGYVSDRLGFKRMIVFSLFIWSAFTWATGHARTFTELLWARAFMGISEACYLPAGLALIAAWHSEKTRAKATGVHYSGSYLGMILGGSLGGWLGAKYGWRIAFLALGMIGIAYTCVIAVFLRDKDSPNIPAAEKANFVRSVRELFCLPGYNRMLVVFTAVSMCNWLVYTWLPLYMYERFHMTLASAGFSATFYFQAGSMIGILIGGWLADRWNIANRQGRVYTQALGLAAAAPCLFLAGFASSVILLICGMLMFGLGRGVYDANAMPALCQIAPSGLRATGYGFFNFVGSMAGGVVATLAGALKYSVGIGGSLQIASGLLVISALILISVRISPAVSHERAPV